MDTVDTSALEKTAQHLANALERYEDHPFEEIGEPLRSGVVQNYGTCW